MTLEDVFHVKLPPNNLAIQRRAYSFGTRIKMKKDGTPALGRGGSYIPWKSRLDPDQADEDHKREIIKAQQERRRKREKEMQAAADARQAAYMESMGWTRCAEKDLIESLESAIKESKTIAGFARKSGVRDETIRKAVKGQPPAVSLVRYLGYHFRAKRMYGDRGIWYERIYWKR